MYSVDRSKFQIKKTAFSVKLSLKTEKTFYSAITVLIRIEMIHPKFEIVAKKQPRGKHRLRWMGRITSSSSFG